tara:strand:+ start:393 stop:677 length:285 start_codon:yes stop_codon:yes gene_type:complete
MTYLIYDMKENEWWCGPEKGTTKNIHFAYMFDDKILDEKLAYTDLVNEWPNMLKIPSNNFKTTKEAINIAKKQRKIYLDNIIYLTKFDILIIKD